ncbi:hypothetical protein NDU88_008090 [Pleurodeles waltl]|uniref:Uncharacterized protein n=1 Tax=Pleurodeles waltl TaxID=8319 RepID=A0AAV7QMH9_PLEWA|nr:hypothetical protein NDU88_008090 [Pleurodeles waltl]
MLRCDVVTCWNPRARRLIASCYLSAVPNGCPKQRRGSWDLGSREPSDYKTDQEADCHRRLHLCGGTESAEWRVWCRVAQRLLAGHSPSSRGQRSEAEVGAIQVPSCPSAPPVPPPSVAHAEETVLHGKDALMTSHLPEDCRTPSPRLSLSTQAPCH